MKVRTALIAGGGIVGLVAGRALALKGVEVTLLERKVEISDEGGIGIGVQSNAMNALGEIGVAQQCVDAGVPVEALHTCTPAGELIFTRPTERYCGSPWPGFTGISRAALHAILARAAAEAGVKLLTGAEVAGAQCDAEQAHVELSDGRRFSADLLVGAEGIYSRLRGQLFPSFARAQPTGEAVWRALAPGVQKRDVSFIFGGGLGTVGYTPLKGDLYLYIVDRADHAPPRDATDLADRMIALLKPFGGFVPELVDRISKRSGDVTYRKLESVLVAPSWFQGRILLIGDAAHAGPPTLAQGAAMGIEDGVVLAQCLEGVDDLQSALVAFVSRRFPRVNAIVGASLLISRAQMEPGGQAQIAEASRAAAQVLSQPY